MRQIINPQMQLGELPIEKIELDLNSRDDVTKILRTCQHVHCTPKIREQIFAVLEKIVPEGIDRNNGCPGMHLWDILVLGQLRTGLNCDFDRLHDYANNHEKLRQILCIPDYDKTLFKLQTIKDNLSLLTPEIANELSRIIVEETHEVVGHAPGAPLNGKCDSFVVETDVHPSTDSNVLYDAIRTVIRLIALLCIDFSLKGWRKSRDNILKIKALLRSVEIKRKAYSRNKNNEKKKEQLDNAYKLYLVFVQEMLDRAIETLAELRSKGAPDFVLDEIERFMLHAVRQIDQIEVRVFDDEKIPHNAKCFSVFEEHTEWISKGKWRTPVELGKRVSVIRDQYGCILHHKVMDNETDDCVAVPIVSEAQKIFQDLLTCSFDKGYHSPSNQIELAIILDKVILPRKGKLTEEAREIETEDEFVNLRRKHSVVESAINCLEVHGLDRCLDHGFDGFKRYVAIAVLGCNTHNLGAILLKKDIEKKKAEETARAKLLKKAA